jgi:hypothetical protein
MYGTAESLYESVFAMLTVKCSLSFVKLMKLEQDRFSRYRLCAHVLFVTFIRQKNRLKWKHSVSYSNTFLLSSMEIFSNLYL